MYVVKKARKSLRGHSFGYVFVFILTIAAIFPAQAGDDPSAKIELGAYYFDGWSGGTDAYHLKERLQGEFSNREPLWGWHDNTPEIMQQQIDLAANAGISFWSFCWYWPEATIKQTPVIAVFFVL